MGTTLKPKQPSTARAQRKPSGTVPLVRALSKLGLASRTQTEQWINAGRLAVNGRVCKNPQLLVVPEQARFSLDGAALTPDAFQCIVLHKPRGYVTTRRDEKGRKTIYELLPPELHKLHAVGRLDMQTNGLLLLTNDTQLSNALTDPRNAIPRVYVVTVEGLADAALQQQLLSGVEDEGELLKATAVQIKKTSKRESQLLLTLEEGKNREIRRLCQAVGHPVIKLKRIAFGPIALGELASGKHRLLTASEELALQV